MPDQPFTLTRAHRTRLLQLWRSAGWPCRDALEVDLIAAGLVRTAIDPRQAVTLHLTPAGFECLAQSRLRNRRVLSPHDKLAERVAEQLASSGRIVWRELSLRARIEGPSDPAACEATSPRSALWPEALCESPPSTASQWRMARPDVFSVRNTSVSNYLHPVVHEIKVSRADLLSDLRHAAKRQAYQWLCCECYYVFPAGVAQPEEIPADFGVWIAEPGAGSEVGVLTLARAARHVPCELPFAAWLALAKAHPWAPANGEEGGAQALLGAPEGALSDRTDDATATPVNRSP